MPDANEKETNETFGQSEDQVEEEQEYPGEEQYEYDESEDDSANSEAAEEGPDQEVYEEEEVEYPVAYEEDVGEQEVYNDIGERDRQHAADEKEYAVAEDYDPKTYQGKLMQKISLNQSSLNLFETLAFIKFKFPFFTDR